MVLDSPVTQSRTTVGADTVSGGGGSLASTSAARSQTRWLVLVLTLAVFVNFLVPLAMSAFLPFIASDLGVTVSLLGQAPAVMMLLAAALGLLVGPLADQFGYRRSMLVGIAAVVIGSIGTGIAPTFAVLLLVLLAGAVGRAAVLPVGQAILGARIADEDARRSALSKIQTGQSGASVVGIPLLASIAALLTWRGAFVALGAVGLLVGLVLVLQLPAETSQGSGRSGLRSMLVPYGPLLHDRRSLALIVAAWLGNAALWIVLTYLAAFYTHQYGLTTQEIGWLYLVGGSGVVVGQLLAGGPLGRRPVTLVIGSRIASGMLMGGALFLSMPALESIALLTLGVLANGASNVATVVLLTNAAPTARATTLTVNGSAMSLGTALGGSLGGLLIATAGYPALGGGALVLALASAVVVWGSRSSDTSRRAEQAGGHAR